MTALDHNPIDTSAPAPPPVERSARISTLRRLLAQLHRRSSKLISRVFYGGRGIPRAKPTVAEIILEQLPPRVPKPVAERMKELETMVNLRRNRRKFRRYSAAHRRALVMWVYQKTVENPEKRKATREEIKAWRRRLTKEHHLDF